MSMSDYDPNIQAAMPGFVPCAAGDLYRADPRIANVSNSSHRCANCSARVHCVLLCGVKWDECAPVISRSCLSTTFRDTLRSNPRHSGMMCYKCIEQIGLEHKEEAILDLISNDYPLVLTDISGQAPQSTPTSKAGFTKFDSSLSLSSSGSSILEETEVPGTEIAVFMSNLESNPDDALKTSCSWTLEHVQISEDRKTLLSIGGIPTKKVVYPVIHVFAKANKVQIQHLKRGKTDICEAIVNHIMYGEYKNKVTAASRKKAGKNIDIPKFLSKDGSIFV